MAAAGAVGASPPVAEGDGGQTFIFIMARANISRLPLPAVGLMGLIAGTGLVEDAWPTEEAEVPVASAFKGEAPRTAGEGRSAAAASLATTAALAAAAADDSSVDGVAVESVAAAVVAASSEAEAAASFCLASSALSAAPRPSPPLPAMATRGEGGGWACWSGWPWGGGSGQDETELLLAYLVIFLVNGSMPQWKWLNGVNA